MITAPGVSTKSGVTTAVTSGQVQYADTTSCPGAFTVTPPAAAAIERESFPPSMAIPRAVMVSAMATAASYSAAPSIGSLAAHIQFPEHLTCDKSVKGAKTRLVSVSPTVILAMAEGESRPFRGASPTDVAAPGTGAPVGVNSVCAMQATSDKGRCSGPTHCCRAIKPVTLRSTLVVRNRLEHTEGSRRTRSTASEISRCSSCGNSGEATAVQRSDLKTFCGIDPRTLSNGRFTGVESSKASCSTHMPSPVT
mmetsp:Transcript_28976/g.67107  ORF Transcript_28976/g.67107 Transcript_28976/m.67107 type:complete len:252 (-) Transcript_28976:1820-2575(-)